MLLLILGIVVFDQQKNGVGDWVSKAVPFRIEDLEKGKNLTLFIYFNLNFLHADSFLSITKPT